MLINFPRNLDVKKRVKKLMSNTDFHKFFVKYFKTFNTIKKLIISYNVAFLNNKYKNNFNINFHKFSLNLIINIIIAI